MESPESVISSESSLGVLEVVLHQARDIQNICIYHKQDVYAKFYLTSDPEKIALSKVINGGGINPVFNDTLRLHIRTFDCSLKCEIYMMSRVKNYLQDQLLGLTQVPLCDVLQPSAASLDKEFPLSTTDLLHSPAGFVHLSLSYEGVTPDVLPVPLPPFPDTPLENTGTLDSVPFPDPKIASETTMMMADLLGSDQLDVGYNHDEHAVSDAGVRLVESFAKAASPKCESNDVSGSSELAHDENDEDEAAAESVTVKGVVEPTVVQQDIVDMYLKSMQEFTDSLAKMKLPLEVDNSTESTGSTVSGTDRSVSKNGSSKVFYGSRAFF